MDKLVLAQKLESLRRCLQRIEQKRPSDASLLTNDADLQDVIVLNLTRAVQLSVDIASHIINQSDEPSPTTMGEAFTTLETRRHRPRDTGQPAQGRRLSQHCGAQLRGDRLDDRVQHMPTAAGRLPAIRARGHCSHGYLGPVRHRCSDQSDLQHLTNLRLTAGADSSIQR